jgi:hypothetical protein
LVVKHGKAVYEVKGLDPSSETVGGLKARLAEMSGGGSSNSSSSSSSSFGKAVKLMYKGALNDDTALLESTKLRNGSKVTMM